jgi:D-alanyl-D-alanine carboxypeptidase
MKSITRCFVTLLLASMPVHLANAQLPAGTVRPTQAEFAARIDSVVRTDILPRGFPSVSIAVTRGGQTLLDRAWGVANVATGQRADASTIYRIGSVTKQFTAALVLKLVDRGKLALTDSIGRYVTGLRPEWNGITIEQLLNHTSGLPRGFIDPARVTEDMSSEARIAIAVARDQLATKPGTAYGYSNTGYMLLSVLVEKLYGKPYATVLRDEVAKPLGLASLRECDDLPSGRAAAGYTRWSDGKHTAPNNQHVSQARGGGNVCATAGDVAKWNHALHNGRVVSAASYAAMTTPRGAAANRYGFGLFARKSIWGTPALMHDGAANGFYALNGWYPADSLSVTVLLSALPPFNEVAIADFVGLIALGGTPKPIPPVRAIELPVAATQGEGRPKFVGAYERTIGSVFMVTFEDGNLYVTPPGGDKTQLFLKSGNSYAMGSPQGDVTVTFNVDARGVTGFTAREGGNDRELRKVK